MRKLRPRRSCSRVANALGIRGAKWLYSAAMSPLAASTTWVGSMSPASAGMGSSLGTKFSASRGGWRGGRGRASAARSPCPSECGQPGPRRKRHLRARASASRRSALPAVEHVGAAPLLAVIQHLELVEVDAALHIRHDQLLKVARTLRVWPLDRTAAQRLQAGFSDPRSRRRSSHGPPAGSTGPRSMDSNFGRQVSARWSVECFWASTVMVSYFSKRCSNGRSR